MTSSSDGSRSNSQLAIPGNHGHIPQEGATPNLNPRNLTVSAFLVFFLRFSLARCFSSNRSPRLRCRRRNLSYKQAKRFPQPTLRPQAYAQVSRPLEQLRTRPSLRATRSQNHHLAQQPFLAEAIRQFFRRTIPLPCHRKCSATSGSRVLTSGVGFLCQRRPSHPFDERWRFGSGCRSVLCQRASSCD